MEAVLLDLTGSLFLDGKTPLAAALRRELAAVTGMEVTALSADPAGEDCYDTLADALDRWLPSATWSARTDCAGC